MAFKRAAAAVVAGTMLAFAAAPHAIWWLAIPGLAVLFRAIARPRWRERLTLAWLCGFVMFLITLSWVRQFSVAGWIGLSAFEALVFGSFALLVPAAGRRRSLAFVGALGLIELIRHAIPWGGLPLGGFSTGQASGPLLPAVSLIGESGLVMLLAVLGVAVARFRPVRGAVGVLMVVLVTIAGAGVHLDHSGSLRVATIQAGGPPGLGHPNQRAAQVFADHARLTSELSDPVDLIVWPENVIEVDGPIDQSAANPAMGLIAESHRATVVAGIVELSPTTFRNAAVAWNPEGDITDRYDKVRRVPFGEFVPARRLVSAVADVSVVPRSAIPGKGRPVIEVDGHRLGVAISYEGLFADRARLAARSGGQALLLPSNASSYTYRSVADTQVEIERLRARETGRWVVQATPTGRSAVIDDRGRVRKQTSITERAILQDTVQLSSSKTPYTRWGNGPVLIASLLMLGLGRRKT